MTRTEHTESLSSLSSWWLHLKEHTSRQDSSSTTHQTHCWGCKYQKSKVHSWLLHRTGEKWYRANSKLECNLNFAFLPSKKALDRTA
jgi:hypothetical protein